MPLASGVDRPVSPLQYMPSKSRPTVSTRICSNGNLPCISQSPIAPPPSHSVQLRHAFHIYPQVGIHRPPARRRKTRGALSTVPLTILSWAAKPVWTAGCFVLGYLPGGARRGGRRPQVDSKQKKEAHSSYTSRSIQSRKITFQCHLKFVNLPRS